MESTSTAWTRRLVGKLDSRPGGEELPAPLEVAPPAVVVQAGCSLDGRLVTERLVQVEGDFRGSIESSARVVVAEGGSVVGDIRARSVTIHGAVVGDVSASREVQLRASGRVQGDVVTSSFELERGAYFNGNTRMLRPQDRSRSAVDVSPPGPPL